MNSAFNSKNEVHKSLENLNETATSTKHVANIINGIFLSPMNDFSPLASYFFACTDFGSDEPAFTVTEQAVFMKLSKVNPAKANGPDGIPSWVLKENADLLADLVKEILNLSYRESYFPQPWKEADIVPLPKQKPVKDLNKHLRPTSLTLESLANTRTTATIIWSLTIALILKDKGECKLHGLKRCAMP
jgi:hypothetical protein